MARLNFKFLVLDTCLITVEERVLFGPNVCLYSAMHPMDPAVRQGLKGPEEGKEIHIEDAVWTGGSVLILGKTARWCSSGSIKGSSLDYPYSRGMLANTRRMSHHSISLPEIQQGLFGKLKHL
jgi:hypothetical protein